MAKNGDFCLKTGIIGFGSPILAQKCQKVEEFGPKLAKTLEDMKDIMKSAHGVGLAANQVGLDLSVFVFDSREASGELINPQMIRKSGSKLLGEEGCLSSPGLVLELARATHVRLSGQTRDGETVEVTASGFLARIFQHEIDHLNGICIANTLKRPDRRSLERTLRQSTARHS